MSNKLRIKLIIVLAVCMIACTFAGCSIGFMTYNEFLEEYDITAQVTYYGNGGYFSENASILSVEISYTTGSMIYTPVEGTSSQDITRSNYDLSGWYNVAQRTYAETNDDGEEEQVLYFVLDVTEEELAANTALVKEGDNYYFEYTSELTTVTADDDDDEDTSDSDSSDSESEEFDVDDDAEIDTSYLTQRMYYVKDSDGAWIMSQEDYDYYVRLKREYNSDSSITVPNLVCGDEMDASYMLKDGEHLYMVADWTKSVSINYYLAMKEGETATSVSITVSGATSTIEVGGLLYSEYFGTQSSITRTDSSGLPSSVTFNNATVLAFYYDKDCTQPVKGTAIAKPTEDEEGNISDVAIYAQCVAGVYTVVRDADGVEDMFNSTDGDYYIYGEYNDPTNKVIDCSGITVYTMTGLRGEIRGNGTTLTNLTVNEDGIGGSIALFGYLYDGAKITDLTIDGMQAEYQTTSAQAVNIYLVGILANGATDVDIGGLTIKNAEVKITLAARSGGYTYLRNMQYVEKTDGSGDYEYETDNWLYGDESQDAVSYEDDTFKDTYGGATIDSCTVQIRQGLSGEYVTAISG